MKKYDIRDLIQLVNDRNKTSVCDRLIREGWNALLECVLHDAGVYAGFGYLTEMKVPAGQQPGIVWGTDPEGTTYYPDDTRREYYIHKSLR